MIQFYSPDIEETLRLGSEDSAHCAKVLRKKAGDTIYVTDGRGHRFECRIALCTPKVVDVEIAGVECMERNWKGRITLCVAPTKKTDRMEWMVEKCVELGVDRIIPLVCMRSERKFINEERLRKIAVSAMKQSLKVWLPEISDSMTFRQLITSPFAGGTVMGYCNPKLPRTPFTTFYSPNQDIRILIGPEGDFSPEEVEAALAVGIVPVTFGAERLRTETAAVAAVETVHVIDELAASGRLAAALD